MNARSTSKAAIVVGFLCLATLPALVLADTALAYHRGWKMAGRLDKLIVYGAAAVLLVTVATLVSARGRAFLAAYAGRFVLLLLSLLAAGLLIEGTLWAKARRAAKEPNLHSANMDVVTCHGVEYATGATGEQRFTTNALGIRGREVPADRGVCRILCIGGSTTECNFLDDSLAWPHLLESRLEQEGLSCWVGNAGVAGRSSVEHNQLLASLPLTKEVDGIVVLVGYNDLIRAVTGYKARQIDARPNWSHARVLDLVLNVWRTGDRPNTVVQEETGFWLEKARQRRQQAKIANELPVLAEDLRDYADELRRLCATCKKRKVRLVLLSQPVLWDARLPTEGQERLWYGWMADGRFLAHEKLREGMGQFNEALRAVAQEQGVGYIDLTSMSGNLDYFYDDCHFSVAGSRRLAELVAPPLRELVQAGK